MPLPPASKDPMLSGLGGYCIHTGVYTYFYTYTHVHTHTQTYPI